MAARLYTGAGRYRENQEDRRGGYGGGLHGLRHPTGYPGGDQSDVPRLAGTMDDAQLEEVLKRFQNEAGLAVKIEHPIPHLPQSSTPNHLSK